MRQYVIHLAMIFLITMISFSLGWLLRDSTANAICMCTLFIYFPSCTCILIIGKWALENEEP